MHRVSFTVPGTPKGKGRPRFTKTGHAYTPKETKDYEKLVRECYREQTGCPFFIGEIKVVLNAYFKQPKSHSDPSRIQTDLDNIIKTLDGLNGIAFDDDCRITHLEAYKLYAEEPRLEVWIWGETE